MSDDEEYYDDDFDADWLWFDDGERELADDLAESTMHSPVYMDQGAYDAIDSASDWDYYTDEYFDDDLSVMRKQSLEATTSPNGAAGKKMRKKRKQGEQPRDGNDNINNEDDPNSFCRILWRSSDYLVDQGELYEPGKGEKVALLKNWREIFKDSQPKRDHRLQKSVSSSRLPPQSSFSKSAAGRKQLGRPKKIEKRNARAKIGRIVDVSVFESEGGSGEGSEFEGGGGGGGGGGNGEYLTPPPSFLSASQQEIYEKSQKTAGPSRSINNGKDHNRRTGSHLKSVMSASAQEEIPEPDPIMPSSPSSSMTNSNRRSGRLSALPTTTTTTTTTTTQSATSILQNEEPREPSTSLQDGNGANIADNIPSAGKGNSPPIHRQGRKRKASSPLDNTDGDDRGGKKRSKRATTRRKLDDDDHDDKNTGKSKNKTKDFTPATITTTIRRSLRERRK
ncbi:hypothetical protein EMCG_01080 [[Emmonsia] crescens]|uniref:Uncharacterized protein n=1 Tax=[Emmonsia] crescens TaxID=73230 RepID=A0A0G2IBP8_9EURO|nr:hypothetical protein EMCG_01080 [Emmonsia crescens UAMH 3008]